MSEGGMQLMQEMRERVKERHERMAGFGWTQMSPGKQQWSWTNWSEKEWERVSEQREEWNPWSLRAPHWAPVVQMIQGRVRLKQIQI